MILNDAGKMVYAEWMNLQERFSNIEIDVFQIMPDHFHGIIIIHTPVGAGLVPSVGAGLVPTPTRVAPTIGEIVGAFKSITTHEYIQGVEKFAWPVFYKRLWQRNYYEHIIRGQADYERIADYILDNPARWDKDEDPKNTSRIRSWR